MDCSSLALQSAACVRPCFQVRLRSGQSTLWDGSRKFCSHSSAFARHLRIRIGADGHLGHVTTPGKIGGKSHLVRNASSAELNSASTPQRSHFNFTGFWGWSSFTRVVFRVVQFRLPYARSFLRTSEFDLIL